MEWINVTDSLPEYGECVLVCGVKGYENGNIERMVFIADRRYTNKFGENWGDSNTAGMFKTYTITHWKQLPEPPKE